jgi:hypothetical protein
MIIKRDNASSGYAEYLEHGRKAGRTQHRDDIDERVHIEGSLEEFERVVEHSQQNFNWKTNYHRIVISFSKEDQEKILANPEMANDIVRDQVRDAVGPGINLDDVVFYAEMHVPKQHTTPDENGGELERLAHIHIGIAKYSPKLGKQLNIKHYREHVDEAFQTKMNYKYGMTDPAERREVRDMSSKARGIARNKASDSGATVSAKTAARLHFADKMTGVTSIEEIEERLKDDPLVKSYKLHVDGKSKRVAVALYEGGNINLRGRGFDDLVKTMYGEEGYSKLVADGKHEPGRTATGRWKEEAKGKMSREKAEDIVEKDNMRHYNRNKKLYGDACYDPELEAKMEASFDVKPSPHASTTEAKAKKFQNYYRVKSAEQRNYWRAFKTEIDKKLLNGFSIVGKTGNAKILDPKREIFIRERDNKLSVESGMTADSRKDAIALMLQRAISKNVDIDTMKIEGSRDFVMEARKQVADIVVSSDYKKPENPSKDGALVEVPRKKPGVNTNKSELASARNAAVSMNSAAANIDLFIQSSTPSPTVEITEHDDAFTIYKKMEPLFKKAEAERQRAWAKSMESHADAMDSASKATMKLLQAWGLHVAHYPMNRRPVKFRSNRLRSNINRPVIGRAMRPVRSRTLKPMFISSARGTHQAFNAASQKVVEQSLTEKLDITQLKAVDAQAVIDFAVKNNSLIEGQYVATEDNTIQDTKSSAAPKTNIDFLMRTCRMSFSDAVSHLKTIQRDLEGRKEADFEQLREQIRKAAAHIDSSTTRTDDIYDSEEWLKEQQEQAAKIDNAYVPTLAEQQNLDIENSVFTAADLDRMFDGMVTELRRESKDATFAREVFNIILQCDINPKLLGIPDARGGKSFKDAFREMQWGTKEDRKHSLERLEKEVHKLAARSEVSMSRWERTAKYELEAKAYQSRSLSRELKIDD